MHLQTQVETITPAQATAYLRANTMNRPLLDASVKRLASAIRRREWKVNGESIKFADDGTLIDGQYRLTACVRAGIPITTAVVRGLPKHVFDSLDQGKRRRTSDIFAMSGEKNPTLLSSACRAILSIESDGDFSLHATTAQLENALNDHPGARTWVSRFAGSKAKAFAPSSVVAVLTLGAERCGDAASDGFLKQLSSGAGLSESSPIFILRERLIAASTGNNRLRPRPAAAMIIKAWNAYVTDTPLRQLKFRVDETFPAIK